MYKINIILYNILFVHASDKCIKYGMKTINTNNPGKIIITYPTKISNIIGFAH